MSNLLLKYFLFAISTWMPYILSTLFGASCRLSFSVPVMRWYSDLVQLSTTFPISWFQSRQELAQAIEAEMARSSDGDSVAATVLDESESGGEEAAGFKLPKSWGHGRKKGVPTDSNQSEIPFRI